MMALILCLVIAFTFAKGHPFTDEQSSREQINNFFDNYWQWRLEESPEFATFIGNHDLDSKLESYSLESYENRKKRVQDFVSEAESFLKNDIDDDSRLNLELLITDLSTYISGDDAKGYVFPITYLEGVHLEFDRLVSVMPLSTAKDYENLISRYRALPSQISEIIGLLQEGINLNMTNHAISMDGVLDQLDDLQKPVEESVFYKPFESFPDVINTTYSTYLQDNGRRAVSSDVLPSFKRLQTFIEMEYLKFLRANISVSSLPDGVDFYQKCLDYHLGHRMTPEEVHETGIEEVDRIGKEMQQVIALLNFNVSRKEFAERVRQDRNLYFEKEDELLDAYKDTVFNKIRPKLPLVIKTIPKSPLSIEPAPPSMAKGPAAFYFAGTPDGKRPGTFHVNTAAVNSSPKYEIVTLSLHEAEPGHHLQVSYLMELTSLPDFRRYVASEKYNYGPSRFPLHTAYVEGWALYSEYLGYELDMYEDPYANYGHLSHEMFRACRLVVDTGIHALGWSREEAVNYMLENTALHRSNIENEINRYITWPAQACAYKIGEIKIKELRKMAEKALGTRFDVREFHDIVLRSAGALSLLEREVKKYIQQHSET